MHSSRDVALLAGRGLVALLFAFDAWLMAGNPEATAQYMESFGVPGVLLPLAALCQAAGALLVVAGLATRFAALAFAAYCVATALIFHHDLADAGEITQAGKDLAIAGGFLFLAVAGPGRWSLDHWRRRRR
jgi:putative oxidoreductase